MVGTHSYCQALKSRMQIHRLLVIDSGVGGLSITQKILNAIPHIQVYYIADTEFFPYGMLSEAAITHRVEELIIDTQRHFQPDVIVIACNTASTVVLDHLRARFATPFVGVVPAIKPAAALSSNKHLAVLATHGTVQRSYTRDLVEQFAPDCRVDLLACPGLVELAEKKMRGQLPSPMEVTRFIEGVTRISDNPDTVVLACTHFPLLRDELQATYPTVENWVDSGDAIARRVASLLSEAYPEQVPHVVKHLLRITKQPTKAYLQNSLKTYLGEFEYRF